MIWFCSEIDLIVSILSEKRKSNNENENVPFHVLSEAKTPKLRPIQPATQFRHVSHSLHTEMRNSEDK